MKFKKKCVLYVPKYNLFLRSSKSLQDFILLKYIDYIMHVNMHKTLILNS